MTKCEVLLFTFFELYRALCLHSKLRSLKLDPVPPFCSKGSHQSQCHRMFIIFRFYWREYDVFFGSLLVSYWCFELKYSYQEVCIPGWPLAHCIFLRKLVGWNHQDRVGIYVQLWTWHAYKVKFSQLISL